MPSNPTVPTTTTKIVLPGLVEPEGLQVVHDAPVAQPAAGQLLVAVEVTGITYAEQAMRRGRYFSQPAFPFTPGYDLVGTVLAAGPDTDSALVGRRVAAMTKTGAWTGHAVVQARDSIPVPENLDPELVEALTVNGVTAWQMLHRAAKVTRGQTILVFGANGGVGGVLIQLALHAGIRVIGAASPRHHQALRAAGVEPVDYADPQLADRVRALAPNGVDAVFDNVGGETTRTAFALLARGGTLVSYAIIAAVSGTGSLWPPFLQAIGRGLWWSALPNGKHATFYDLWSGHGLRKARFRRHLEADLSAVLDLLGQGVLQPVIAARYLLTEVAAALTLAESRTISGKIVLIP